MFEIKKKVESDSYCRICGDDTPKGHSVCSYCKTEVKTCTSCKTTYNGSCKVCDIPLKRTGHELERYAKNWMR